MGLCGENADKVNVKKNIFYTAKVFVLAFVFMVTLSPHANAYMVKFKEDWYRLYHVHYQQYPDDCIENIYWLEKAAAADFCNPLFADAGITTEKQWEKYRYLFQMHINLKLIEQHLRLGRTYDKKAAYFYDAPGRKNICGILKNACLVTTQDSITGRRQKTGRKRQMFGNSTFFL